VLHAIAAWLNATWLARTVQEVLWIKPVLESAHIFALGIILSSSLLLALRVVQPANWPLSTLTRRLVRPVWMALIVVVATGVLMVIGEPRRGLLNILFWIKMALLAAAVLATFGFERIVDRQPQPNEISPSRRSYAKALAAVSILLWLGVIFAGRWLAYASILFPNEGGSF
jgi:hypothetical protein